MNAAKKQPTRARAVMEDFPEEVPWKPVLKAGPSFICRTGLCPAQVTLEWPKKRQRQGKPAHHSANVLS